MASKRDDASGDLLVAVIAAADIAAIDVLLGWRDEVRRRFDRPGTWGLAARQADSVVRPITTRAQ